MRERLGSQAAQRVGYREAFALVSGISGGNNRLLAEKASANGGQPGATAAVVVTLCEPPLREPVRSGKHNSTTAASADDDDAANWVHVFSRGSYSAEDATAATTVEFGFDSAALDADPLAAAASSELMTSAAECVRIGLFPDAEVTLEAAANADGKEAEDVDDAQLVALAPAPAAFTRLANEQATFALYSHSLPIAANAAAARVLITFRARAAREINVALSSACVGRPTAVQQGCVGAALEIGSADNSTTRVVVGKREGGPYGGGEEREVASVSTPGVCNAARHMPYWIVIEGKKLKFGRGVYRTAPTPSVALLTANLDLAQPPSLLAFSARSVDVQYAHVVISDGSDLSLHAGGGEDGDDDAGGAEVPEFTAGDAEHADTSEARALRRVALLKQETAAAAADAAAGAASSFRFESDEHTKWSADAWRASTPGQIFVTFQVCEMSQMTSNQQWNSFYLRYFLSMTR